MSTKDRLQQWLRSKTARYSFFGGLVGLIFPLGALLFEIVLHREPFNLSSAIAFHREHPVFWFIETAPLVLGYIAGLAGRREDRLSDLTHRLEQEVEARTSEVVLRNQFFEALVLNSPLAIVVLDGDQNIVSCNPAFEELYQHSRDDIINKNLDDLITTNQTIDQARQYTEMTEGGENVRGVGWRRRRDGTSVLVEIRGVPVIVDGEQTGVLAIYDDITERKRGEDALKESEARYRSLFNDSPISLWEEDFSKVKEYIDDLKVSGVSNFKAFFERNPDALAKCASLVEVLDVNQATLTLYRATHKNELLEGLGQVLTEESMTVFKEEMIALAGGKGRFENEIVQNTMSGDHIHGYLQLSVAPGYEDTWAKVFVSILDITERNELESRLRDSLNQMELLARTDPLTGLLNRRAITEHALAELARAERDQATLGIALIDMDNLKEINDHYGHLVGDEALRQVAETLKNSCRVYDRVGRWGGDEFMVVLPHVGLNEAEVIGNRLVTGIRDRTLTLPEGIEVRLAVSIGVTSSAIGEAGPIVFDELLRQSDEALYRAKLDGRDRVYAYQAAA